MLQPTKGRPWYIAPHGRRWERVGRRGMTTVGHSWPPTVLAYWGAPTPTPPGLADMRVQLRANGCGPAQYC